MTHIDKPVQNEVHAGVVDYADLAMREWDYRDMGFSRKQARHNGY